jgi:hypothetical protein
VPQFWPRSDDRAPRVEEFKGGTNHDFNVFAIVIVATQAPMPGVGCLKSALKTQAIAHAGTHASFDMVLERRAKALLSSSK